MLKNWRPEKNKHPRVFHSRKPGYVKVPYWPVALATDELGYRYLSDGTLDSILPQWRALLVPDRNVIQKYCIAWWNISKVWSAWLLSEQEKLKSLHKPWPAPWLDHGEDMGNTQIKAKFCLKY
jgi:hypothetical protein